MNRKESRSIPPAACTFVSPEQVLSLSYLKRNLPFDSNPMAVVYPGFGTLISNIVQPIILLIGEIFVPHHWALQGNKSGGIW